MSSSGETKLVFVSHNVKDKDLARELALFLTAEGTNVWFDEWEIAAGESIVEEINEGLRSCSHFVVVWSEHAKRSKRLNRELQSVLATAIESGSPRVIPVVLDSTPLPGATF